jgi:succinate dehydrogenase / fumarate reductase cytochrome b subunit
MASTKNIASLSSPFIWRRVHSLMGFWIVIYLVEHLITNSQATLWIGDDGAGFITFVNFLESLPYLQVIESLLIGLPLLIHAIWGIQRALEQKMNSFPTKGDSPHLSYSRNHAFTWQRLSSWILLFGIIGHVIQMRFIENPKKTIVDNQIHYLNKITFDEGLYTLAPRLGVTLYSAQMISELNTFCSKNEFSPDKGQEIDQIQQTAQKNKWIRDLKSFSLKNNEVIAESPSPGIGMLLMVRNTFKVPLFAVLYTIFVLAASFHACNGFWTFLITWGVLLSYRSQKSMIPVSVIGMFVLSFLGLIAIWGSYWINLRS